MNRTIVVLGYQNYGNVENLARRLKKRGKHITLVVDSGKAISCDCCDDLVGYNNYDADEILDCIGKVSHKNYIEDIVNITDRLTYVQYKALQHYCSGSKYLEWILNARIKPECRRLLQKNNVSPVRYSLVKNEADLAKISELVGYPAVIKPAGGRGSDCVYKINNNAELIQRYKEITGARADELFECFERAKQMLSE